MEKIYPETAFPFKEIIKTVEKSITAGQNTNGLEAILDLENRREFSIYVDLPNDDSSELWIYLSNDGVNWEVFKATSFKRRYFKVFKTLFRYVRVYIPRTEIDIKIKIGAR